MILSESVSSLSLYLHEMDVNRGHDVKNGGIDHVMGDEAMARGGCKNHNIF